MRTPRRHSPSRRRRWNVFGSLTPAWSSSFPAGPARSARRAPLAHTCSAHRSSCGDKDSGGLHLYWPNGFTTEGQTSNTGNDGASGVLLVVYRFGHKTLGAKIWTLLKSEIESFFAEGRNRKRQWRKIWFQIWMCTCAAFTQSHLHNFFKLLINIILLWLTNWGWFILA